MPFCLTVTQSRLKLPRSFDSSGIISLLRNLLLPVVTLIMHQYLISCEKYIYIYISEIVKHMVFTPTANSSLYMPFGRPTCYLFSLELIKSAHNLVKRYGQLVFVCGQTSIKDSIINLHVEFFLDR